MATKVRTQKSKSQLKKPIGRTSREESRAVVADFINGIVDRGKRIPNDELDRIPTDLAKNHEHYLYGHPKQ